MRKLILIGMVVLLMMPFFEKPAVEAKSVQKLEQELKELEKKQSELQSKRQSIQQDKQQVEGKMNENLNEQASLEEQMERIKAEIAKTEEDICTSSGMVF